MVFCEVHFLYTIGLGLTCLLCVIAVLGLASLSPVHLIRPCCRYLPLCPVDRRKYFFCATNVLCEHVRWTMHCAVHKTGKIFLSITRCCTYNLKLAYLLAKNTRKFERFLRCKRVSFSDYTSIFVHCSDTGELLPGAVTREMQSYCCEYVYCVSLTPAV